MRETDNLAPQFRMTALPEQRRTGSRLNGCASVLLLFAWSAASAESVEYMTHVPQKPLTPQLFHPTLPRVGRIIGQLCDVWDLSTQGYAGQVPSSRCEGWLRPGNQTVSTDGAWRVETTAGVVNLVSVARGTKTPIHGGLWGSSAKPCKTGITSRFSPDNGQVAVYCARTNRIAVVVAESGATQALLFLGDKQEALQLAWGPSGLVASVRELLPPNCYRPAGATATTLARGEMSCQFEGSRVAKGIDLVQWTHLRHPPKRMATRVESHNAHVLDPLGRHVYSGYLDGGDFSFWPTTFDILKNAQLQSPNPVGFEPLRSYFGSGGWIPGKYPIWQTTDQNMRDRELVYTTWHITTVPGRRTFQTWYSEEPEKAGAQRVLDDGWNVIESTNPPATLVAAQNGMDPSGRFIGMGPNLLRRVSDHEDLLFDSESCARTGRQIFNCLNRESDAQLFRLGPDPVTATLVHAGQLAKIFYRPALVDDFLDGRAVQPLAVDRPLGLPPQLRRRTAHVQSTSVTFELQAQDTGDGLGELWLWNENDGRPTRAPQPIEHAESIKLTFPKKDCQVIRAYACSRLGYLCSSAVRLDPCNPQSHDTSL